MSLFEIGGQQQVACLAVVFAQARLPRRIAVAVDSGDDPDIPLVIEGDVVQARFFLRAHANQHFRRPRRRVNAKDAAKTQRGDPQLSLVPLHAMAPATAAFEGERNLAMGDLLRVHVDLEDAVRILVGADPDATIPVHDTRCVARASSGFQQLAVPFDQPCRFVEAGGILAARRTVWRSRDWPSAGRSTSRPAHPSSPPVRSGTCPAI